MNIIEKAADVALATVIGVGLAATLLYWGSSDAADQWTTKDKGEHIAVSAGIGTVSGLVIKDKWTAFGLAMVPGIAKEIWDSQHPNHTASFKDLAADAVGAAVGVYTGNCVLRAQSITCRMAF